jgi:hypothetical protein
VNLKLAFNSKRTFSNLASEQYQTLFILQRAYVLVSIAILGLTFAACSTIRPSTISPSPAAETSTPEVYATQIPESEITFRVQIPEASPSDEPVFINLLDEVTGLALNKKTMQMDSEGERRYFITLPFPFGSVVKYRYSRGSSVAPVEEHISDGRQLRYRLYNVEGPGSVEDIVTRWTDIEYTGLTGRIQGYALDILSGQPIPGLLIVAGGAQTFTASDGSFLIEGLPPGEHNLVAYAIDGTYSTFQQGAVIQAESTTPAELRLRPAQMVNVTFELIVPEGTVPIVPIRIAGNLYQLGNTFADLSGGFSTIASRMPTLIQESDRTYTLNLSLPEGVDIRYLYTLGDGFWNTEQDSNGEVKLRQIIVPNNDVIIRDTVETWSTSESNPITFDIRVPEDTPPEDTISIQLNPFFGWTESIPMWPLGEQRWAYVLNSPLTLGDSLNYRICRNNQCGSADDQRTQGINHAGLPITFDTDRRIVLDQVNSWAWIEASPPDYPVDTTDTTSKELDFIAGVELQPYYHPSWTPLNPFMLDNVQELGANWLILTPTWTYTRNNPPILDPVTGADPLWQDMSKTIQDARDRDFQVGIFPQVRFPSNSDDWWIGAQRDVSWWIVWFERYRNFILHHADLADDNDAQTLVIGGDWLAPALPAGTLPDGSPSGVQSDVETHWRRLIQDVRSRFDGQIAWGITASQAVNPPPAFLNEIDLIYLQFYAPLSTHPDPILSELQSEAARLLDNEIYPQLQSYELPIILVVNYPSVDGAGMGCLPSLLGESCLNPRVLSRPNDDFPDIPIDLIEQADIYQALVNVTNQRDWINGFVTGGYYPPALLQDKSTSIHGKPAQNLLREWFISWRSLPVQ